MLPSGDKKLCAKTTNIPRQSDDWYPARGMIGEGNPILEEDHWSVKTEEIL